MKATFDVRTLDRTRAIVVVASLVVSCALFFFANQYDSLFNQFRVSDYEVGKSAPRDLVSDRTLSYVDADATSQAADQAAARVAPVFEVQADLVSRSESQFDQFAQLLTTLASNRASVDQAYSQINEKFPGLFSRDNVSTLLRNLNLVNILPIAAQTLDEVMSQGILALQESQFDTMPDTINVVRVKDNHRESVDIPLEAAITARSLSTHLRAILSPRGLSDLDIRNIVLLVGRFATDDAFYSFSATQKNRERARAETGPVINRIVKGERVIKKGEVITALDAQKIRALGNESAAVNVRGFFGTALLLVLLYGLAFTFLGRTFLGKPITGKHLYLLLGLFVFYAVTAVAASAGQLLPDWLPLSVLLPTALIAMIVTILVNMRVGIVFSLLISLGLFLIAKFTAYSFLFAFLSSAVASYVVSGAERRIDLIRASLELATANSIILVIFGLLSNYQLSWYFIAVGWGALNGFLCGVLNLGLLPIFEHLLNAPTPFRLMELSDMNSPMLKRMLTLAPGTYGHSVSVANLAESACRAIGANALLARVGAYYHDIGKIDQSEYFIENQRNGNKHDELKPSLSAAVIKSHVKIGIERAKELGLPQEVIDIIAQHHGSGLISYFYARALKDQKDSKVNPEDFSYPGSPPASREAAVVMLADSVEAASRTLKKPTVAKLERFIWSSIMEKFTSGQMNESDLTFSELEIIKRTFLQILAGHFHSRIEYPDAREVPK